MEKANVQSQVNVRSYEVRTEDGATYRRNRRHLKATQELPVNPTTPINLTTLGDQKAEVDSLGENDCPGSEDLLETSQCPTGSTSPTSVSEEKRTRYGRISRPPSYLKDYVRT